MKRHILLAACLFVAACLTLFGKTLGTASDGKSQQLASDPVSAATRVVVHAAGRGNPYINFEDGVELPASYEGAAEMQSLLKQNAAEPRALASADFDEDGVPDLICGYARPGGGIITLYRGNVDSIYQNSPEAQRRKAEGTFSDSAFLSPGRVYDAPIAADFAGAGDFDADGHWDVVIASLGVKELCLLPGDGKGSFLIARQIALPGAVTSLITGEINRADGLTDVVVGVVAESGPQALVFEGLEGALKVNPEVVPLPGEPRALALGQFDDDYPADLAVGAGSELVIIHGRDRKLSLDEIRKADAPPAKVDQRMFGFEIASIAAGDFAGAGRTGLALLAPDGTVLFAGNDTNGQSGKATKGKGGAASAEVIGQWRGVTQLFRARVSAGRGDDLLLLNRDRHELQIVNTAVSVKPASSSLALVRVSASLDFGGEPLAVLPMRLNADALTDLVSLQTGHSPPSILKTTAATTFTVNKSDDHDDGVCDSGDCTLREAINASNSNLGADVVTFNIPGTGVHMIMPTSFLPMITDTVAIDGTTQPGFAGSPLIEVNGSNGGNPRIAGLRLTAPASTVRGLVINRFSLGIALNSVSSRVEGNFIGTDATGMVSQGNSSGVFIGQSSFTTVGGTTAAARNIIAGNQVGVALLDSDINQVQGNLVGTGPDGIFPLGNTFAGVSVRDSSSNSIGGTTFGAGNIIAYSGFVGVHLSSTGLRTSIRNSILANSIFSSGEFGIFFDVPEFKTNDPCDADTGINEFQNFPVLTSATLNGFETTIQGTLNSNSNTAFRVEFFTNTVCSPSGSGEGRTFVGSTVVSTDGSCNASFIVTLHAAASAGQFITATATDAAGNTSMFSRCVQVQREFDLCLQDESNGNILLVNSTSGEYQFNNCRGTTLTGIGSLSRKACLVTLQVNGPDRRILARIDTCSKTGNASIQLLSQGTSFSILDRNTANNSCACAGPG